MRGGGAWTVCRFRGGGLGKGEGVVFLRGVVSPMRTYASGAS